MQSAEPGLDEVDGRSSRSWLSLEKAASLLVAQTSALVLACRSLRSTNRTGIRGHLFWGETDHQRHRHFCEMAFRKRVSQTCDIKANLCCNFSNTDSAMAFRAPPNTNSHQMQVCAPDRFPVTAFELTIGRPPSTASHAELLAPEALKMRGDLDRGAAELRRN